MWPWFSSFLKKRVREPGEPFHVHPHREVLAFDALVEMCSGSGCPMMRCGPAPMHFCGV